VRATNYYRVAFGSAHLGGALLKSVILCLSITCISLSANSQNIFVHSGNAIHAFSQDSIAFFTDIEVDGELNSDVGANIIFYGLDWKNNSTARFEGQGRFSFIQPSPLGGHQTQSLGGVNWDNRFPSFKLSNAKDLNLDGVAGNRDTFLFDTGCVILNKNDFVIGNNNEGVILNYTPDKFFVTNHDNTADTGFLVRERITSNDVDFPIGNSKGDYTPLRIANSGVADTFFARVFPNVYFRGDSGTVYNDLTVGRTWNILENTPGGSSVTLTLQHNTASEGISYSRSNQFVSRYWDTANNSAYLDSSLHSFWDYASPSNGYSNSAGNITTGPNIGHMATRSLPITTFFSKNSPTRYFTKASTSSPVPISLLYLTAKWAGENTAEVSWGTASELNNQGFEVYRSYDGNQFEYIHFEPSAARYGNSNEIIDYEILDSGIEPSREVVYYKLVQVDYDGSREQFGPVVLRRANQLQLQISIYPIPATSDLFIALSGPEGRVINGEIINMLGQSVQKFTIDKTSMSVRKKLDVESLANGNYWINLKDANNTNYYIKPTALIIAR
jgi:hypothetical protein